MGVVINWKNNEFLREAREDALRTGLRTSLVVAFGKVPRWAELRIQHASAEQLDAWLSKVKMSKRIEDVMRRR